MAQGDLAGVAHEDVQPDGDDAVNNDQVQQVDGYAQKVGLDDKPGQQNQNHQKNDGPSQNGFALEEFNILVIGPLDIHASHLARNSNYHCRLPQKRCDSIEFGGEIARIIWGGGSFRMRTR